MLTMRVCRSRTGMVALLVLTWQIVALIFVPAAACCQAKPSAAAGDMANCPMRHDMKTTECPMHAPATVDHDCHCPKLGCAQTDQGFLALLGPIGVLPAAASTFSLHQIGDAVMVASPSSVSLAPVPAAPPPRV
jgi:hypothetical protein